MRSEIITYTNEQVRNIMRNEGLDYAVLYFMELEGIRDEQLKDICLEMRNAKDKIEQFMIDKYGENWTEWEKEEKKSSTEIEAMDFNDTLSYLYEFKKRNEGNCFIYASYYCPIFKIKTFDEQVELFKKILEHDLYKNGSIKFDLCIHIGDEEYFLEKEDAEHFLRENILIHPMTGEEIKSSWFEEVLTLTLEIV
ncbi:MAG: hypothetical protein AABY15_01540 [Nanoarchaeota archaeon]